jgi:branched-chain amino acid aminotransferase
MLTGNKLLTPVSEGCLNGVMRKQVLEFAKMDHLRWLKKLISPFDLHKKDEVFTTNVIINTAHTNTGKNVVLAKVILEN